MHTMSVPGFEEYSGVDLVHSGETRLSFSPGGLRRMRGKEKTILKICEWFMEHYSDIDTIARYIEYGDFYLNKVIGLTQCTDNKGVMSLAKKAIENLTDDALEEKRLCRSPKGFVYLLQSGPFYKIGMSKNVDARIKALGTLPPFDIDLLCTIETSSMRKLESELHEQFADKRKNGEWFELDENDVEYIKELAQCQTRQYTQEA